METATALETFSGSFQSPGMQHFYEHIATTWLFLLPARRGCSAKPCFVSMRRAAEEHFLFVLFKKRIYLGIAYPEVTTFGICGETMEQLP